MSGEATKPTRSPTKRKRPEGKEQDDYEGHKRWTFQRWAWEFLRRNEDFQEACKLAAGNPEAEKEVAATFGLKKFVSYTKGSKKPSWAPKFRPAAVDLWSWQGPVRRPAVAVRAGQVLVRFDLSHSANDSASLSAQIEDARRRLETLRKAYLSEIGPATAKASNRKPIYFINSIRLLDMLANGIKPGRALRILHELPGARAPMSDREALDKHRKQLSLAKEMASSEYRTLSTRAGAPVLD